MIQCIWDTQMRFQVRAVNRLPFYAYFYYMAAGDGLNPDLAAVYISSRLSNLLHYVKFQHLVTQLVIILGQIMGL